MTKWLGRSEKTKRRCTQPGPWSAGSRVECLRYASLPQGASGRDRTPRCVLKGETPANHGNFGFLSGELGVTLENNLPILKLVAALTVVLSGKAVLLLASFPSNPLMLSGELDVKLLVRLLGSGCLVVVVVLAVPVGRREDADGDGDAAFKVQVDDFPWRERIYFSYNLSWLQEARKEDKKGILRLLFKTKVEEEKGKEKEIERISLLIFFS